MNILVTGATGYIGARFTLLALSRCHNVIVASRKCPSFSTFCNCDWIYFDLLSNNITAVPVGTKAILHLAANTQHLPSLDVQNEMASAVVLIQSAQEAGAKFIYVSSQTARVDAPTSYGRTKWQIEQEVLSNGGWVVRPGQVYGGPLRGLFGTLAETVRQLPILPAFIPAPLVQPIHVDDLVEGLLRIAERDDIPPTIYCLAEPEPVLFTEFLALLAKSRLRCRRFFVPVPVVLITALGFKLRSKLGLERLLSLFNLPAMATAADLKQIGLALRPLRSGMHPSGDSRRRSVLQEGAALLKYVLKAAPGSAVLRRYVRMIEQLRGGLPLGLPQWLMDNPVALSVLEASTWADPKVYADYAWRLDAATLLAEATPLGSDSFLGVGKALERQNGKLCCLIAMTNAVGSELLWRFFRIPLRPLIRLSITRANGAI